MAAAMVLMETPAIIMAVVLASTLRHAASAGAVRRAVAARPRWRWVLVAVRGPATAARRAHRCCMSR
jgi:hypothetical protein